MLQLVDQILQQFRSCFKRRATWCWFVVIILGFMVRSSHRGVTSIISDLRLNPRSYHNMLGFFRSKAYDVCDLNETWTGLVVKDPAILRISGRLIMPGDHIKIGKEGRRMPDIQILHQESENSGKGEFIAGHTFAQIGAIVESGNVGRCVPLVTQAQQSPPKIPGTKKPDGDTLVIQTIKLGLETAEYAYYATGETTIGVYDSYFSKQTAFQTAESKLTPDGRRLLNIVTRAQDSYVGFLPRIADTGSKRSPGRPKIYGDKVKLKDLLKDTSGFTETTMTLYGKKTKVRYICLDLLWKPIGETIRFVVLDSDRGQCILMTDDLTLSPEEIITIYTLRFKIETSFDEQKNVIGCFEYHFWTMTLEKRKKRKASVLPQEEERLGKVNEAKKAISTFVCLSTIATGILTIIAFKHNCEIWKRYPGWIRTLRISIPGVTITREAFATGFHASLRHFSHLPSSKAVLTLLRSTEYLYSDFLHEVFNDAA